MVARDYEDCELRVWRGPGGYEIGVSSGGLSGTETFASPFREGELEGLLTNLQLQRDLAPAGETSRPTAQEIGQALFETVFKGRIRRVWDNSLSIARQSNRGLRLRLNLQAPELWGWPWEYLYDPDSDFLTLNPEISVIRSPEIPLPVPARRLDLPFRVLVATAHPRGLHRLGAEQEWQNLVRPWEALRQAGRVELHRVQGTTLSKLRQAIGKPAHIFHFIGHGVFERRSGEGALLFEKKNGEQDRVTGSDLARILRRQPQLGIVVLNSCEGGRAATNNPFSGVAQRLVREGVPAVVAMQSKIADEAAILFSQSFYEALTEGQPVDRAVYEARHALFSERFETEWGNPVLYMRSSTGRIFDLAQTDPIKEAIPKLKPEPSSKEIRREVPSVATILIAVLLSAAALGGGYWAWTIPSWSSDPECPSPPGLDVPFVKIESGLFRSPTGKAVVTPPFCMAKYEVTQHQWRKVLGKLPRQKIEEEALPVVNVTRKEAQEFIAKLNELDKGANFRLPTNAQWEYAARAGTKGLYSFNGSSHDFYRYGNCKSHGDSDDGYDGLAKVGSFNANSWGLHDMYGNVAEWVDDSMIPSAPTFAGLSTVPEPRYITRGGSFENSATNCNSVYQSFKKRDQQSASIGFRIVRDVKLPR